VLKEKRKRCPLKRKDQQDVNQHTRIPLHSGKQAQFDFMMAMVLEKNTTCTIF